MVSAKVSPLSIPRSSGIYITPVNFPSVKCSIKIFPNDRKIYTKIITSDIRNNAVNLLVFLLPLSEILILKLAILSQVILCFSSVPSTKISVCTLKQTIMFPGNLL
jgi:hypothetical protein